MSDLRNLSRREREIMDILYRLGKASAAEVRKSMDHPPGYSAVRAMLRVLETKGHVKHLEQGLKYVFVPAVTRERAKVSVLRHLVDTFFNGSAEQAMAALLDVSSATLTHEELDRMAQVIEKARQEGR
jgi:BlaI family penicillinase repressor